MQHWSNQRERLHGPCLSPASLKAPITLLLEAPSLPYQITNEHNSWQWFDSVKEDYSFALTRIDTVYNSLVDTRGQHPMFDAPSRAKGQGLSYIIIKDLASSLEQRGLRPSTSRKDRREILKFKPDTWARVFKTAAKKALLLFLLYLPIATVQSSHSSREFAVSNGSPGCKQVLKRRKAHFLEGDCICWAD